jgi:hypothetical protein
MVILDKTSIEIPCPKCEFLNPIFLGQARLQDVIICRGCKSNIYLSDQMAECQQVIRRVQKELDKLMASFKKLGGVITIKI